MFQRIKNLWDLGRFKPSDKAEVRVKAEDGKESKILTLEEDIPLGDGKAVFLGEGTTEEFEEQERADKGFKGIFGLFSKNNE